MLFAIVLILYLGMMAAERKGHVTIAFIYLSVALVVGFGLSVVA